MKAPSQNSQWPNWISSVAQAQQGDLASFERLVRRFEDMAVGYAYAVLGDFDLAKDAAQEAFIQAYLDLPTLREPVAFPSWLRRIVYKHCDRLTRRKRFPSAGAEAAEQMPDPTAGPLEIVQARETHDAVLGAVNALPQAERAATTLFYINGYSLAEVGAFLEVPVSTVKNRLHAARQRLRADLVGMVEQALKCHAPNEGFSQSVRHVLEGVPRVGFYRSGSDIVPEDVPFAGCLGACLRYLGEGYPYLPIFAHGREWRLNYATVYVMGTSGLAFGFLWSPGWHVDNTDHLFIAAESEDVIRRAFDAAGYACELVERIPGRDNAAHFRRCIVESIRVQKRPVMAFGVVGPPACCIVTGYDEEGAVLLGWSYFQDTPQWGAERETSGYFRRRDWFAATKRLVLIGDRRGRPPLRNVYRRSLQWALKVARQSRLRGRYSGLAAYEAWAAALAQDGDFPAHDEPLLRQRHGKHDQAVDILAEARCYASEFLRQMASDEPGLAESLLAASACYGREHDLMWEVWRLAGGYRYPEAYRHLADPEVRRRIAAVILQTRELDIEAAAHLERALAAWPTEGRSI